MFAILSKLGVYVLLRLTSLLFPDSAGDSAHFGDLILQFGGIATIVFGTIGVLASQGVARIACFSVLVSSGTLLAILGYGNAGLTAGALYYLVSSTLGLACLFLLIELMERGRSAGDDVLAITLEAYGDDEELVHEQEVGTATPGAFAALGVAFICCAILIAGLPPLAGFLGKFAMIDALLGIGGPDSTGVPPGTWVMVAMLIISGLAATIALMRTGINTFWVSLEGVVPAIRWVEVAAIVMLLGLGLIMTVYARPVMTFMAMAADALYTRGEYVQAVLHDSTAGVHQ
jgi:multicomponent K+:H+ antiporter subunit D